MAKDTGLLIIALVAVVAVVGLVMLLKADTGGAVVLTMEGEAHRAFDRPLGSNSPDAYGLAQNVQCYEDAEGQIRCDNYEDVASYGRTRG